MSDKNVRNINSFKNRQLLIFVCLNWLSILFAWFLCPKESGFVYLINDPGIIINPVILNPFLILGTVLYFRILIYIYEFVSRYIISFILIFFTCLFVFVSTIGIGYSNFCSDINCLGIAAAARHYFPIIFVGFWTGVGSFPMGFVLLVLPLLVPLFGFVTVYAMDRSKPFDRIVRSENEGLSEETDITDKGQL